MTGPVSILITGASSGLGAALAGVYAARDVTLFLGGRSGRRLAEVAHRCENLGAGVEWESIDVTDRSALAGWISSCDDVAPLDLVIANAGISAGTGSGGEDEVQARAIFTTNLEGVVNTVHPALERMQERRHGQVAIMSSLAGFRGFPGAPAYCGSKAAVRVWGEGLRGSLAAAGVQVSVICPGFVKTPMTAVNPFPMPFLVDADRAAQIIKRALARNKARISFPWPLAAAIWLLALLPPGLTDRALQQLPEKG